LTEIDSRKNLHKINSIGIAFTNLSQYSYAYAIVCILRLSRAVLDAALSSWMSLLVCWILLFFKSNINL
jgi:hypothetical protein